jgi:hypothetical protein
MLDVIVTRGSGSRKQEAKALNLRDRWNPRNGHSLLGPGSCGISMAMRRP